MAASPSGRPARRARSRRLGALALLAVIALVAFAAPAPREASVVAAPHSARVAFGEDASTQMLVAWGLDAYAPQWIELGPAGAPERATLPAHVVPFPAMRTRDPADCSLEGRSGSVALKGCADQPGQGYVASVALESLAPGTRYEYRLGAPGAWSETRAFSTAPRATNASVTFTAFGDTPASSVLVRPTPRENAEAAAAAAPDFHVHLGDLNYVDEAYTRHVAWWREWFADQSALFDRGAYQWALGNHELDVPSWKEYFGALMPGASVEDFPVWSVRWGSVAVVAVDAHFEAAGAAQTSAARLDAELAEHRDATWKVVVMHAGPYAVRYVGPDGAPGGHGSNCQARDAYAPVLARHGVALVLSGHDHNYQRSHAVDPRTGGLVEADAGGMVPARAGVVYFVAGSGGKLSPSDPSYAVGLAGRAPCDASAAFNAAFLAEPAYLVVRADARTLAVESRSPEGRVLDAVRIVA